MPCFSAETYDRAYSQLLDVPTSVSSGCWPVRWRCQYTISRCCYKRSNRAIRSVIWGNISIHKGVTHVFSGSAGYTLQVMGKRGDVSSGATVPFGNRACHKTIYQSVCVLGVGCGRVASVSDLVCSYLLHSRAPGVGVVSLYP